MLRYFVVKYEEMLWQTSAVFDVRMGIGDRCNLSLKINFKNFSTSTAFIIKFYTV